SSCTHVFDEIIDAIQRGAESEGFVLDRYHYPWLESTKEKTPEPATLIQLPWDAKDKDAKDKSKSASPHFGKPGSLLFRRAEKSRDMELLFVFLVGETPTFGVDKVAMIHALNEASEIVMVSPQPVCGNREIKILSPSFSGSQTSLILAFQEWAKEKSRCIKQITVIGGASAIDKPALDN